MNHLDLYFFYDSVCLRWHTIVNECIEHLMFKAHLSTLAGSHLNATCIDCAILMWIFVTRDLSNITISKLKVEVACLFL